MNVFKWTEQLLWLGTSYHRIGIAKLFRRWTFSNDSLELIGCSRARRLGVGRWSRRRHTVRTRPHSWASAHNMIWPVPRDGQDSQRQNGCGIGHWEGVRCLIWHGLEDSSFSCSCPMPYHKLCRVERGRLTEEQGPQDIRRAAGEQWVCKEQQGGNRTLSGKSGAHHESASRVTSKADELHTWRGETIEPWRRSLICIRARDQHAVMCNVLSKAAVSNHVTDSFSLAYLK